jgi:beta-glucosidase
LKENAVAAAKNADAVVMALGISPQLEGEEMSVDIPGFSGGDRTSLDLPAPQQELLEAIAATGKPLVVVLLNGSALAVNWAQEHANAILEAWYPGEEGGTAVADTLAGENNPAGRLPVTFYKSVSDLPAFTDYSMKGRTYRYFQGEALYRFGDGLSYSKFVYRNAQVRRTEAGEEVSVEVANASERDGDEVVQAYISTRDQKQFHPPNPVLVAFRRVHVRAHARVTVDLPIAAAVLTGVDEQGALGALTGTLHVEVGGHQPGAGTVGTDFVRR